MLRALTSRKQQMEVAQLISSHNIALFGLLETKVKGTVMGSHYETSFPGWCFSHNSTGRRILLGWKGEQMIVNILFSNAQIMHLKVKSTLGDIFLCSFVYATSTKKERILLFTTLEEIAHKLNKH